MADFSAKHYMIKSEKNAVRAEEAADRAKSYADSINPETFVKNSGDQTIGGVLRVGNTLSISSNGYDYTTPKATSDISHLYFYDKNGALYAAVETTATATENGLRMTVRGPNGNWCSTPLHIYNTGTSVRTTCPTPPASDNSAQIATTAWVRNNAVAYKKYSSSVAITTPTSTSNQYTCPSNGLLWGSLCFGDTYGYIWINGTQYQLGRGMGSYNNAHSLSLYLNKGDVIYFQNTSKGDWTKLYFLPTA